MKLAYVEKKDGFYIISDVTCGGYLQRCNYLWRTRKSKWDKELKCTEFNETYAGDCLKILEDKEHKDYRACKRAYNRHLKTLKVHLGILKEEDVNPKKSTVKFAHFDHWSRIRIDEGIEHEKSFDIGHQIRKDRSWTKELTPENLKLIKKYNDMGEEMYKLRDKIFKEKI
jgi:hypothetical protein